MNSYVLGFAEIDKTKGRLVGGKGANLGELAKIAGIQVPEGFCLTTHAYQRMVEETPQLHELLDQLSLLTVEERDKTSELSAKIRKLIAGAAIPPEIRQEISRFLARLGDNDAYAVRSSATAEDLPTASFAGQQDTYLNIRGQEAILTHIKQCWASLFSERAVTYRLQNNFDQRKVYLAVVIQKMVFPQAAGTMFTADPITSNRKVLSIDAGFGLGEAVVSGLVNADSYQVREGEIIDKKIAAKKLAMVALPEGGTHEAAIAPERQQRQALADEQILQLARMGREIESHFGSPQDIEWCWADDSFYIVQSRPITTLFPIPQAHDQEYHVYLSVGHQQMMTDPLKPLGLSLRQLNAMRPMFVAAGRQFVDIAQQLAAPAARQALLNGMAQHDPLMHDAIATIVERGDFSKSLPDAQKAATPTPSAPPAPPQLPFENDPAIVSELMERNQRSVDELRDNIQTKSGVELLDFILEDIPELRRLLGDPQSTAVFMAAINASAWVNEKMKEWLGETNVADTLSQSVPNNITSEMGLALLDVADVIRPHSQVVHYLQQVKDDGFLDELPHIEGGEEARDAINAFLDKYGMRGAGEIDLTRPRWREKPTTLLPIILNNVKTFEPGEGKRKFEQGRQEALAKEKELLARLRQLPDGEEKAAETKRMISQIRNFIGYLEYPKYGMMNRYFVYKQALLQEAERMVQAHVLREKEDIYYLTLEEVREVARTQQADYQLIDQRKDEYKLDQRLSVPRVITSDGEIPAAAYKRENLPAGALAGLAVSAGVVEGRARVILKMEDADLEAGDILVTTFTDPSWTPLFVSIKGLVTEVGGLMTHGAVIAREYGLPAVVGVENATKLIQDGQRIRVNGTDGYIEILPGLSSSQD
jgi:pyruvate,water dikinase